MPSVSQKQHNLMAMVANNPAKAKQVGIPQSVGEEFMQADKGKKFGSGSTGTRADIQSINNPKVHRGKMELFARGGEVKESKAMEKREVAFMKKKGAPKSMIKHEESEMKGMKKGGYTKKMAGGGDTTMSNPSRERSGITAEKMGGVKAGGKRSHGEHAVQERGHTRGMHVKMGAAKPLGMKRGGKC